MAGWGDDPVLDELRGLLAAGWEPVGLIESRDHDTVFVAKDGAERALTSDHIAFHRLVEAIVEEHPGIIRRS